MFAITLERSITGLNQLNLKIGYFLVKNAGNRFINKKDIVMVVQENLKLYIFKKIRKNLGSINYSDNSYFIHEWIYLCKER